MKTKVQELYEEWCGEDRHVNDCHPVHDSSETIEFAEYYYNAMKELEKEIQNIKDHAFGGEVQINN